MTKSFRKRVEAAAKKAGWDRKPNYVSNGYRGSRLVWTHWIGRWAIDYAGHVESPTSLNLLEAERKIYLLAARLLGVRVGKKGGE